MICICFVVLFLYCPLLGYGYPHPGAFNPFMLNPAWLDAAYMTYGYADYFRHQAAAAVVHHPALAKTSPLPAGQTVVPPPNAPAGSPVDYHHHPSQITPPPSSAPNIAAASIIPSPPGSTYGMPQFPFNPVAAAAAAAAAAQGQPELLLPHQKANHPHAFHPYNLAALRARPPPLHAHPNQVAISPAHISPASSRPSSSSPVCNSGQNKFNTSADTNSLHEQSTSDNDSDDEQIDVVKSAFVPILRPQLNSLNSSIDDMDKSVDSTRSSPLQQPNVTAKTRSELKAPSSLKPYYHEPASQLRQSPPDNTALNTAAKHKSPTNTTQKTVWRPY